MAVADDPATAPSPNWRCLRCDVWNAPADDACLACDTDRATAVGASTLVILPRPYTTEAVTMAGARRQARTGNTGAGGRMPRPTPTAGGPGRSTTPPGGPRRTGAPPPAGAPPRAGGVAPHGTARP